MELLTVLEPGETPQIATWYALVPKGETPDVRVGHTLTYVPDTSEEGKVIIVGGANPNGSFSDAYILDLGKHEWNVPEWKGLFPRYEHSSFISMSRPGDLWLFGGADECSNRNCVQVLNFETGLWRSPAVNGTPPTPRTCHGSTAAIGDCLYVFGGGDKGAEPVPDTQLYMFDKATLSWSQLSTEGNPPAARHGHVMIAVGSELFIHGGLAGDKFFNDMYVIDTAVVNMRWKKVKMKGDIPRGCAAHSAIYHGKYIFIFGGMDVAGALNTMYKYHVETSCWTRLEFGSSLPTGRLDHAMCVIPWKIRMENDTFTPAVNSSDELSSKVNKDEESNLQSKTDVSLAPRNCIVVQNQRENIVNLCLVFGGMDTQGEIYNDCFVTLIEGY
ncbi:rab9 effector protein with kelch motifs [Stegostoma tigrinum]|uniref:rab9 effector protein with kelch motifs n=1 Tax=Stegostoma tigrinum TaxID=3053191 RepID=UPI002870781A|nr:rab9 effector protein with kelch motifs [Stegostoma tigrinum]XP_048414780.2 rab9 effector protein with kelch motifs [Stegostoma tigrinum]